MHALIITLQAKSDKSHSGRHGFNVQVGKEFCGSIIESARPHDPSSWWLNQKKKAAAQCVRAAKVRLYKDIVRPVAGWYCEPIEG